MNQKPESIGLPVSNTQKGWQASFSFAEELGEVLNSL